MEQDHSAATAEEHDSQSDQEAPQAQHIAAHLGHCVCIAPVTYPQFDLPRLRALGPGNEIHPLAEQLSDPCSKVRDEASGAAFAPRYAGHDGEVVSRPWRRVK